MRLRGLKVYFRAGPCSTVERAAFVPRLFAESDGNAYFLLDPAAEAIEGKHPLAAMLLRRAMIEDTLNGAKYKRYRHAERHMREC